MHRKSYGALRDAYRHGELSPVDVARSALAHAEQVQKRLNAFALIDYERALSQAVASAERWKSNAPLGPIDGMPFTVKEFAAVAGWPTRRGSALTSSAAATESARFVQRALRAGAVLLGKTRAPEFNWKGVTDSPGYGVTRNPLQPELTPGGSSGGCSAAVAAGVVRVSLGSDAGGSVRIPAAFTGVLALKPTYGRIPMVPPPSAFFNVVNVGPIAASVSEMAEMMQVISGPDAGDGSSIGLQRASYDTQSAVHRMRVGLLGPEFWSESAPMVRQGMQEALACFQQAGFDVRTVDFDVRRTSEVGAFFYRLGCRAVVQGVPADKRPQMDPGLLAFVEPVLDVGLDEVQAMQTERDRLVATLHALFNDIDVLLLPTMPILPFEAGRDVPKGWPSVDWFSWNPYTPAFNLAQTPALSFPWWPQGASLPMGLQMVSARGADDAVVALAAWLETQRPVVLRA